MLHSYKKGPYEFELNLLAQSVQYPEHKLGICIVDVGVKGCGKTTKAEIRERMYGEGQCFRTEQPQRDVWGDNNAVILGKFSVQIAEGDKQQFKDSMNAVKTKITDGKIRVRALYGAPQNVTSRKETK